jgi:hypothetical protein
MINAQAYWEPKKKFKIIPIFAFFPPSNAKKPYKTIVRILEAIIFTNKDSEKSIIINQWHLFRFFHSLFSVLAFSTALSVLITCSFMVIVVVDVVDMNVVDIKYHVELLKDLFLYHLCNCLIQYIFSLIVHRIYERYFDMLFSFTYIIWKLSENIPYHTLPRKKSWHFGRQKRR